MHALPSERYNNLGNRFSLKGAVLGKALADVVSQLADR